MLLVLQDRKDLRDLLAAQVRQVPQEHRAFKESLARQDRLGLLAQQDLRGQLERQALLDRKVFKDL